MPASPAIRSDGAPKNNRRDLRIERAKRLLADGDFAVEALSPDVGYDTPAFGACSAAGLSASPYRRMFQPVGRAGARRESHSAREHYGRLRASTEVPTPLWT